MNVPGASAVFNEGYITYSNAAKEKIVGVSHETLEKYTAVSKETAAEEMASGAARVSGADVAVSVTGIAGAGWRHQRATGRSGIHRMLRQGKSPCRGIPFYR